MKTIGSLLRIQALVAAASLLLVSQAAQAAGLASSKGTQESERTAVWICLAAFVLGTLVLAFWNSKRRETE